MSSICGSTTTIGAPRNIVARECPKPENCVPAMGWQPMKVHARPSAISKQRSHTARFTPTASITSAPGATRSAWLSSHSTQALG